MDIVIDDAVAIDISIFVVWLVASLLWSWIFLGVLTD
jgi:hypothetical protein